MGEREIVEATKEEVVDLLVVLDLFCEQTKSNELIKKYTVLHDKFKNLKKDMDEINSNTLILQPL